MFNLYQSSYEHSPVEVSALLDNVAGYNFDIEIQHTKTSQLDLFASEDDDEYEGAITLHWSDRDLIHIQDRMIVDVIQNLNDDRANGETISEAVQWIFSDDLLPFSFIVCCQSAGLDPFDLRIRLGKLLKTIHSIDVNNIAGYQSL